MSRRIAVTVKPGAKVPGVEEIGDGYVIRVRERAIEGSATAACIRALARHLAIAPSRVVLLHGDRSRQKLFEITD